MKKLLALCLVLLFLVPGQVFAHSKMTKATPANNDILTASPDKISMEFNTDIASLSTFTLENELGELIAIDQISVEGHTLFGIPSLPLANSNYTVKWTIIGADGHTVDGSYSFKVNAPEVANETEPEATPEQPQVTATPEPTVSPSPIVADENNLDHDQTEQSSSSNIALPIAIIAIFIALAVIFATKRNKK